MNKFRPGELAFLSSESTVLNNRDSISVWKSNSCGLDTIDNEMVNLGFGTVVMIVNSWLDNYREIIFVKFLFDDKLYFVEEYYLEKLNEHRIAR